jgi:SAM-dependent methyltransferase
MVDWNKRYAEASEAMFGRAPNRYVVQTLARDDFDARSALCLADGDGRNGRYLAQQGLEVTAVDLSTVGTEFALRLDDKAGVTVQREAADLAEWTPAPTRQWDAVFLIYLHCERHVRQRAVEMAVQHLVPGGWFIAEGFAADTGDGPRMGPPDPDLRYRLGDFESWLPGWQLEEAFSGVIRLQEGSRHQGLATVVRYAARKIQV